jgi:hypothetical protein
MSARLLTVDDSGTITADFQKLFRYVHDIVSVCDDTAIARIVDHNGKEPFVATLCVGLICCMRSFGDLSSKQKNCIRMCQQYVEMLSDYRFVALEHSTHGMFTCLKCHKIKLRDMPEEVLYKRVPEFVQLVQSRSTDYYAVQRAVHRLFNEGLSDDEFHSDYNNYMTFIVLAFQRTAKGHAPSMCRFVKQLIQFHVDDDDDMCVYDHYAQAATYTV